MGILQREADLDESRLVGMDALPWTTGCLGRQR